MKPEWCPQWAWDEAKSASHEYLRDARVGMAVKMTAQPYPLYEHFARALLDARNAAYEDAARVAENCPLESFATAIHRGQAEYNRGQIATAIRSKIKDKP